MSGQPLIVLMNPPSDRIVIRDNFCSKVSQAFYINHPIDLLFQSGFLKDVFDLAVIDAIVDRLSTEQCISMLQNLKPKGIFGLAGNASWHEDASFYERVKLLLPDTRLVLSGDLFLETPRDFITQYPFIDGILLDFTSTELTSFFRNRTQRWKHLIATVESSADPEESTDDNQPKTFTVPIPAHDLFIHRNYRYPFVKKKPFATVMTEYGCPFQCAFCVMGTLEHKYRPVSNVIDEIREIYGLGIRDVFFLDQSFGTDPDRSEMLYSEFRDHFSGLRWLCFSRVDLLNEALLRSMKSAGCHTIILGVETADPDLLERYRKGYTLKQVRETFHLLKKLGIRSVATFLLGLPGETWDSALRTIQFARTLDCDFASLNVAVPRMGTDLRKLAIQKGYIDPEAREFDQSGSEVVMSTESLTREDLLKLKKLAIRRLYFRPSYIMKRMLAVKSWPELVIQSQEGWQLLKNFLFRYNDHGA